jgi:hypothetical protein
MGNTVIIPTIVFDIVFYFVILLLGVDFLLSGLLVLRKNARALEKPKLLGLWLIKITYASNSSTRGNRLYFFFLGLRNMGWYTLFAGIFSVISSLLMLYSKLMQF